MEEDLGVEESTERRRRGRKREEGEGKERRREYIERGDGGGIAKKRGERIVEDELEQHTLACPSNSLNPPTTVLYAHVDGCFTSSF